MQYSDSRPILKIEGARGTPRARAPRRARGGIVQSLVVLICVLCSCAPSRVMRTTDADQLASDGWDTKVTKDNIEFIHTKHKAYAKFTLWPKNLKPLSILTDLGHKMDDEDIKHTEIGVTPEIPGAIQLYVVDPSVHEMRTVAFTTDVATVVGITVSKSEDGSNEISALLSKIGRDAAW